MSKVLETQTSHSSATEEQISSGSVHDEFKEYKEVKGLIESINHVYNNQIAVEMAVERFQCKLRRTYVFCSYFLIFLLKIPFQRSSLHSKLHDV